MHKLQWSHAHWAFQLLLRLMVIIFCVTDYSQMLIRDRSSWQHGARLFCPTVVIGSSTHWMCLRRRKALCLTTKKLRVSFYTFCFLFECNIVKLYSQALDIQSQGVRRVRDIYTCHVHESLIGFLVMLCNWISFFDYVFTYITVFSILWMKKSKTLNDKAFLSKMLQIVNRVATFWA